MFAELKLRQFIIQISITIRKKAIKIYNFGPNLSGSRNSSCIFLVLAYISGFGGCLFLNLLCFLQRFRIVNRRHARKQRWPKFLFLFKIFIFFIISLMETKDNLFVFRNNKDNTKWCFCCNKLTQQKSEQQINLDIWYCNIKKTFTKISVVYRYASRSTSIVSLFVELKLRKYITQISITIWY